MTDPIAIIGMACRVPGAEDTAAFWRALAAGVDAVRDYTRDEQAALGVPAEELDDPDFVAAAPVIEQAEWLDAELFGMTGREADVTDPHHRLFLELTATALEDAGIDPVRFPGRIGVYAGGGGGGDYKWRFVERNAAVMRRIGPLRQVSLDPDYVGTLTSFRLGLRGPSLTTYTACSTSLVTVHLAAAALRAGDCEVAVAGGVHISLPPGRGYVYEEGSILSPDGRCRAFDASGHGTIWGSGGGTVVLKPLSAALRDGDPVRAVLLGTAVNNDGRKSSFTGPSEDGQVLVVRAALDRAGVDPRTVTYVEAHATGTAVGDPVEVAALTRVYRPASPDAGWCGLGSVKSNIGHLAQAAGVVGLIKVALAMEHEQLPPTLHVRTPNPAIDLETGPFRLVTALSPWPGPRRAGISSFGVGGTNAHAVLEEPGEVTAPPAPDRPAHVLRLSARTPTALAASVHRLAAHLSGPDLGDVAHTLAAGRTERAHRAVAVVRSGEDPAAVLADPRRVLTATAGPPPRVAFLFSGQGAQYAGMGARLYATEAAYAAAVDECTAVLGPVLDGSDEQLRRTEQAQPALFTVEYALARLWQSWGVEPVAMVGHSIGEYVAATLAGVFTLPDALRLVATRGRLMQAMPPGSMLAVPLPASSLDLPAGVEVAAVNAPGSCVVAGPADAVEAFAAGLEVETTALHTSHAFHSAMMEAMLAPFAEAVAAVPRSAPTIPFLSNLTGTWIGAAEATDPAYWTAHLRSTVQFGQCLATLRADGPVALVECGPGRQLASLARVGADADVLPPQPSLPGPDHRDDDPFVLATTAGRLWTVGVPVAAPAGGRVVPLPTYPYERTRHWVEPDPVDLAAAPVGPAGPLTLEDWFSVPVWRQEVAPAPASPVERCLAFTESAELVAALRRDGTDVVQVVPGTGYGLDGAGRHTVRPGEPADLDALVADLSVAGGVPARVLHAWAVDAAPAGTGTAAAWVAQDRGFFTLLGLARALAAAQLAEGVHLDVLTTGTQDVTGADLTRPEDATVAGIAQVLPIDMPGLTVRHVDLEPGSAVDSALAEVRRPPAGGAVALRGARRWRREFQPVPVPAPADPAAGLRDGGVYLITGGLGGLGLAVAEDLARRVQARLVLVGRRGLAPAGSTAGARAAAAVRRIEAAGGEVLVCAADVTDPAGMAAVRTAARERFGRVDGILHAAGTPGGGLAELRDTATAREVLAPKLAGTLTLAQVFGADDLDVVVLFSSVIAVVGVVGQVDYCAANAYLDAVARSGAGFGCRVLSIDWGGWLEVGMAAAPDGTGGAVRVAPQPGDLPVDHPLLTTRRPDGSLAGMLAPGAHWLLGEHRVGGVPVLPGTGHLELLHCAVREMTDPPTPGAVVELRDVTLLQPLAVPETSGAEVSVTAAPAADGWTVTVSGPAGTYAEATAVWISPDPAPRHDLEAVWDRGVAPPAGPPPDPAEDLLRLGPRFPVPELRVVPPERPTEHVARISAGELLPGTWLQPALLDRAITPVLLERGGWLPFSYGRVLARQPLPDRVLAHVRHIGGGPDLVTVDVTVTDESGTELVAVTDLLLRRTTSAPSAPSAGDDGVGIRPADGAEALARLLAADLGPQVVVLAEPLADLQKRTAAGVTAEEAPEPAEEPRLLGGDYVPPRTDLEVTLTGIWSDVLGIGQIGVNDDFFELGGNSLVGLRLVAAVRKEVGTKLPMRTLFDEPTVGEIAARIEDMQQTQAADDSFIPRLPR